MIIITSGKKHLDIDAFASGICLEILLKSLKIDCAFITTADFNSSICKLVKDFNFDYLTDYNTNKKDKYILLDVSNPQSFDKIVDNNNIIEIIDHHNGFENIWKNKQNLKVQIEKIGSVSTLIFEKFLKENKLNLLNDNMCKLLIAGIMDNTLCLQSKITTNRDIFAYNKLKEIGKINDNYINTYFKSCDEEVKNNFILAMEGDTRVVENTKSPKYFGQLLVYNKDIVLNRLEEVFDYYNSICSDWILNIICLEDGKGYIITDKKISKEKIIKILNVSFEEDVLILEKYKLRKEILNIVYNN